MVSAAALSRRSSKMQLPFNTMLQNLKQTLANCWVKLNIFIVQETDDIIDPALDGSVRRPAT